MVHQVVGCQAVRLLDKDDPPLKVNARFVGIPSQFAQAEAGVAVGLSKVV
jgi:hypothetical protein